MKPWAPSYWRWSVISLDGPGGARRHEGSFRFWSEADDFADVLRRIGIKGVAVRAYVPW